MTDLPYIPPTPSPIPDENSERLKKAESARRQAVMKVQTAGTIQDRILALAQLEFACRFEMQAIVEVLGSGQ